MIYRKLIIEILERNGDTGWQYKLFAKIVEQKIVFVDGQKIARDNLILKI